MGVTLKLGGQEFRCIPQLPVGLIFDMVEHGNRAAAGEADPGLVMRIRDLVNSIVEDDEIERLWAHLRDKHAGVSLEQLTDAIEDAVSEYAGRPTERPSGSSAGGSRTGGTSKGGSSSGGTGRAARTSPGAGR